jgi:hypothetical protein
MPEPPRVKLLALGGAYAGLSAWMFSQERAMRASGGPGIVGFELAGSPERAVEILATWGAEGRAAARRSLMIDYGVLAAYGPLMSVVCRSSAQRWERRGNSRLASLGRAIAAAQLLAALSDVVENTALLAVLHGRVGPLPAVAKVSAIAKFSLLGTGLIYLAVGTTLGPQSGPRRMCKKG